jgi:hypothetical protein
MSEKPNLGIIEFEQPENMAELRKRIKIAPRVDLRHKLDCMVQRVFKKL